MLSVLRVSDRLCILIGGAACCGRRQLRLYLPQCGTMRAYHVHAVRARARRSVLCCTVLLSLSALEQDDKASTVV